MIPGFSSNLKSWFCEYWTTTDEKITANILQANVNANDPFDHKECNRLDCLS